MRTHFAILIALLLSVSGCTPTPPWYGVPAQHKPVLDKAAEVAAIPEFGEFVNADEPNADRYFIKDVKGLEGSWRWTLAEPEFRFLLKPAKKARRFQIRLGINDTTFKTTGPVTIEVFVNGNAIGRATFPTFGDHTWEKAVEAGKLVPGGENRVLVKVLNPWQAPDAGVRLGFILHSVGFLAK